MQCELLRFQLGALTVALQFPVFSCARPFLLFNLTGDLKKISALH